MQQRYTVDYPLYDIDSNSDVVYCDHIVLIRMVTLMEKPDGKRRGRPEPAPTLE